MNSLTAALVALALAPAGLAGELAFTTTTYPLSTGIGTEGAATLDFDGDGDLDLAVGNRHTGAASNNRLLLFENDGSGGLSVHSQLPLLSQPTDVQAGDLDGDGDADLVVGAFTPGNSFSVFLGDGAGGFGARTDHYVNAIPTGLALGDVDGDGDLDVVVSLRSIVDHHVGVAQNDGTGAFAGPFPRYEVAFGPADVLLADLDGDAALDVVSVDRNSNVVSALLNDGAGGLGPATSYAVGDAPNRAAAGDLDGDGDVDLAVSNGLSPFVTLWLGDGVGGFTARVDLPHSLQGYGLALADLDADGGLDIAMGVAFTDHVSLFRNLGGGAFAGSTTATTGYEPRTVVAADLDGDGKPDLASADDGIGGNASTSVLRNVTGAAQGSPFCPGDGTGGVCPCTPGVLGAGCASSATGGALLAATGTALFSADGFGLLVSDTTPDAPGLCVKGSTTLAGGFGNPIGDGLLCTSPELRSQILFADAAGSASLDDWRGQPFGSFPGCANVGAPTYYQWWFRDAASTCSGLGFNFSNGWEVTWLP